MPRPISYAVLCLKKKREEAGIDSGATRGGRDPEEARRRIALRGLWIGSASCARGSSRHLPSFPTRRSSDLLAFSTSQRLRTTRASARTFFTFRHYITPSARNF